MPTYKVQSEQVSYKGKLYAPGESFDATEQEAAGWLQAGYVKKAAPKKKSERPKK